jgi:hypothetical protein
MPRVSRGVKGSWPWLGSSGLWSELTRAVKMPGPGPGHHDCCHAMCCALVEVPNGLGKLG